MGSVSVTLVFICVFVGEGGEIGSIVWPEASGEADGGAKSGTGSTGAEGWDAKVEVDDLAAREG